MNRAAQKQTVTTKHPKNLHDRCRGCKWRMCDCRRRWRRRCSRTGAEATSRAHNAWSTIEHALSHHIRTCHDQAASDRKEWTEVVQLRVHRRTEAHRNWLYFERTRTCHSWHCSKRRESSTADPMIATTCYDLGVDLHSYVFCRKQHQS